METQTKRQNYTRNYMRKYKRQMFPNKMFRAKLTETIYSTTFFT